MRYSLLADGRRARTPSKNSNAYGAFGVTSTLAVRWKSNPPRPMQNATAALVTLLLFSVPASGWANMRAPRSVDPHPSSTVLSTEAEGLVVLAEQLDFRCEAAKSCDVSATYQVQSPGAMEVELAFIAPSEVTINARVGDAAAPVTTVPTSRFDKEHLERRTPELQEATLYEARFRAKLAPGKNNIVVTYSQPLGSFEAAHGYLVSSRFIDVLRYEVWPLQEWTLAEDFTLDVTLSVRREAPGFWTRNFGSWTEANCVVRGAESAPMERLTRADKKGWLVQTWRLGSKLPDRIECYRGEDDIIPGLP
jgi:hypothetical protein